MIACPVEVCFDTSNNAAPELVVVANLASNQKIGIIIWGEGVTGGVGKAAMAPANSKVAAKIESGPVGRSSSCNVGNRRVRGGIQIGSQ